jgi:ectoine utilization protein EutC
MSRMIILTEAELRAVVKLDLEVVSCIENAFHALATKAVAMPPILRLDIPEHRGEVDVKTAYVPGLDGFAIKISPGFFDNPKLGLPSTNGMMVLLSAKTGLVQALLAGQRLSDGCPDGSAAGAVAAKHLAREDASVAAIFGAGMQARLQLQALTLVRPIREARIWARDAAKAETMAAELTKTLGIRVTPSADPQAAVTGANIVVTTTPSETPILKGKWLEAGQHITAVGSDAEHKNEIDPTIVVNGYYVADSVKQTRRLGELHHAIAAGLTETEVDFPELGQIVAGLRPGRTSRDQITIADLTGTGIQDTAIATLAFARAGSAGAGTQFES